MGSWKKRFGALVLSAGLAAAALVTPAIAAGSYTVSTEIDAQVTDGTNTIPEGTAFIINLAPLDGAPAPAQTSQTVVKSGTAKFGPLTYTVPGDYYYTLSETAGSVQNVTYDTKTYTVMVRVINDQKAPEGLAAAVTGWVGGMDAKPAQQSKPDVFSFTNSYGGVQGEHRESETDTEATSTVAGTSRVQSQVAGTSRGTGPVRTGDESPIGTYVSILAAAALASCLLIALLLKRRKSED
mgnify:CR=1 FL=1